MAEGKDSGDGKTSPFGNHNGAPAAGPASGAHNFATDPKGTRQGGDTPRDLLKAFQRPQSEAKPEVVPATEEIPAGGKLLKADPVSGQEKAIASASTGPTGKMPFKNLK